MHENLDTTRPYQSPVLSDRDESSISRVAALRTGLESRQSSDGHLPWLVQESDEKQECQAGKYRRQNLFEAISTFRFNYAGFTSQEIESA